VLAVTYGILFRPLPYHDASRIVRLDHRVPFGEVAEWQARLRTVEDIAVYASADHALRGLGEPRIVRVDFVNDRFFDVLQAATVAGRPMGRDTGISGLVVSDRLIRAARLDRTAVVGTTVTIVGRAFTVLGVMPATVDLPSASTDVWLPGATAQAIPLVRADDRSYGLLARVKPGITLQQVSDDATRVRRELSKAAPQERENLQVLATPLDDELRRTTRPVVMAFAFGALLVLTIACANVASLLLTRTAARERELAIRLALGSGHMRIVKSLFADGLMLALAGSALGLVLAFAGLQVLRMTAGSVVPRLDAVRIDFPVLLMTLLIACVVALACTIGPGLQAMRRGLSPILRQTGAEGLHAGSRLAVVLASGQIALSIVVLLVAVLLGRSIFRLLSVDSGVNADRVLTMKLMLSEASLLKPGERQAFVQQLLDRLHGLPGVQRAGFGSNLPPDTSQVEISIRLVDTTSRQMMMNFVSVTPEYADALGMRVLKGRFLRPDDAASAPPGVVVSPSVARHLFLDRDPIGQEIPARLPGDGGRRARVVGVIDEVRYSGLIDKAAGAIYVPWERLPLGVVYLVVRTTGDPAALAPAIRSTILALDPAQPIANIRTLDTVITSSIADRRLHAFLASSFAGLAFGVALLGLVATLGRTVVQRRHELAVRAALGATPIQALGLIMRHAAALVCSGVTIGILLGLLATRAVQSYLFGVTPTDFTAYTLVSTATIGAALLACLIPAYRASLVDPATLLRSE
jgi:putative ABC transport system permease protein